MPLPLTNCEQMLLQRVRWTDTTKKTMGVYVGQALSSEENAAGLINWPRVERQILRNFGQEDFEWIMEYGRRMAMEIRKIELEARMKVMQERRDRLDAIRQGRPIP